MAVPKNAHLNQKNKRKTVWKRIALKQSVSSLYSIAVKKIGDS
jgi:hypothetical protein